MRHPRGKFKACGSSSQFGRGKRPITQGLQCAFGFQNLCGSKCPSADQTNKQTHCNTHALRTAHKRHQIVQLDKTKIRHPICCMRIISATSCKLQKLNRVPADIINFAGPPLEQRQDLRPSETMSPYVAMMLTLSSHNSHVSIQLRGTPLTPRIDNLVNWRYHHGTPVRKMIQTKTIKTLTSSQPPVHESSGAITNPLSETALVSIAVQYSQT